MIERMKDKVEVPRSTPWPLPFKLIWFHSHNSICKMYYSNFLGFCGRYSWWTIYVLSLPFSISIETLFSASHCLFRLHIVILSCCVWVLSPVRNKWISKYNQTCVWNFPFLEWIQVYCFCIIIKLNRKHLKIQGNVHGLRFDWLEYWLCTYFACELQLVFSSYPWIVPFSLSSY
jgi:hypothetical protein